jgi:hypothetical protein
VAAQRFPNTPKFVVTKSVRKLRVRNVRRASRVFAWLHVDITLVQTVNDGVQRVAFVKDNYSKAILGYTSADGSAGSQFIRTLFEEVFQRYDLLNAAEAINILSDGGSENKGSLLEWINQLEAPPGVRKISVNSPEFEFSNSMAESTHSIFKTEFMRRKHSLQPNSKNKYYRKDELASWLVRNRKDSNDERADRFY